MIRFENLTKIYPPNTTALEKVSFEVRPNEFVCIVGRSGAGKTTLLKLLLAMERPSRGDIFFEGKMVSAISSENLCRLRQKIGVVFQDYRLFPSKTVEENVAYVMQLMGKSDEEIKANIPEILEIVGLEKKASCFPVQLSGGEMQRAAIARAIAPKPKVLLADEPTGNLDPYNTQEIVNLLKKINQMGSTVILATHDREIVNNLEERVVTLDAGRLIRDEKEGKFII